MADGRDDKSGRFAAGNSGKPKGAVSKAPAEARAFLRSIFEREDVRKKLDDRIVKDIEHGDGVFTVRMYTHAYGNPPAELNVDARGDLRTALLAAFHSRAGAPSDDGSSPEAS